MKPEENSFENQMAQIHKHTMDFNNAKADLKELNVSDSDLCAETKWYLESTPILLDMSRALACREEFLFRIGDIVRIEGNFKVSSIDSINDSMETEYCLFGKDVSISSTTKRLDWCSVGSVISFDVPFKVVARIRHESVYSFQLESVEANVESIWLNCFGYDAMGETMKIVKRRLAKRLIKQIRTKNNE